MTSSSTRWLPLTGILFIALVVTGILLGGETPTASDTPEAIGAYYTDNKGQIQLGVLLFGLGLMSAVVFASYLRTILDRGDGETGILPRAAFAGIVIFAAGAAFDGTLLFAMSEAVDDIDPVQLQTMQAVWDNDFVPVALGTVLFVLASGLSIVRHRSLPVWLGWLAILVGIVGLTPYGFFAFIATGVWVVAVSVVLLMSEGSAATAVVE
jgi:hypothetical protein